MQGALFTFSVSGLWREQMLPFLIFGVAFAVLSVIRAIERERRRQA